ncbi:DUF4192 domain-containing protein [Streptomyces spiramenti]|uniref:DUF4192 domain-containing protein n=1 Tax=Streptomyces spiramenti TaxID=2720606 RepID=A0ABX1AP00_9ACTN|nr:DUF4192 domain-containing protein [Streptomyces spiramenti]NJP66378.1 DUF4192 domain-containing protein [Streptomyces spiramenti]
MHHNEATEPSPVDTTPGSRGHTSDTADTPGPPDADVLPAPHAQDPAGAGDDSRVTLRGPGELADALPYLLGYYPDDSIVLVALHGPRHRVGGRVRTALPQSPAAWDDTVREMVSCLSEGSAARTGPPGAMVVYLCQDPGKDETPTQVMERLRPLAQVVRTTCGARDVPVLEALCVSGGRYFSYCCPEGSCCPPDGFPLREERTPTIAAAAAYAGVHVQGSLRDLERRVRPLGEPVAGRQLHAFDVTARALVPRMLARGDAAEAVRAETLNAAERVLTRYRRGGLVGGDPGAADSRDDSLLTSHEAAALVLGLQDRVTRDRAARWMEGDRGREAARLWRALARRCVGAFEGHAPAPLTLAGWTTWSLGEEAAARVAIGRALELDPDYTFARLLHHAVNDGMDPEPLRRCMRDAGTSGTP